MPKLLWRQVASLLNFNRDLDFKVCGLVVNPRVFQAAEGRPTTPTTHVKVARVFRAAARRPPRGFDCVGRRAERAATTLAASRQADRWRARASCTSTSHQVQLDGISVVFKVLGPLSCTVEIPGSLYSCSEANTLYSQGTVTNIQSYENYLLDWKER